MADIDYWSLAVECGMYRLPPGGKDGEDDSVEFNRADLADFVLQIRNREREILSDAIEYEANLYVSKDGKTPGPFADTWGWRGIAGALRKIAHNFDVSRIDA